MVQFKIIPKMINNTTMEILALIELISLSNSRLDTFYFEMKDTLKRTTDYAVIYNGEQVSAREYPSFKITSHFT